MRQLNRQRTVFRPTVIDCVCQLIIVRADQSINCCEISLVASQADYMSWKLETLARNSERSPHALNDFLTVKFSI